MTSFPLPREFGSGFGRLRNLSSWARFNHASSGAVGLYRDRLLKSSHKAHLWGMYVTPNHRRQGIASELLKAVLRHAAYLPGVSWVHLKVSAATPNAQRLYERAGFYVWGTELAGARYDGQTVADHHMALCLEPDKRPA